MVYFIMIYSSIIPYQELLGNYDVRDRRPRPRYIIPYQELLGNYDLFDAGPEGGDIIPYQELLGNYDRALYIFIIALYYTIPRAIREL